MGKAALDGLPGVDRVTRGFRYGREINTVFYDPDAITIDRMVQALRDASTWIRTVEPK